MAFTDFKSLQDVALPYQVSVNVEPFIEPIPLEVPEHLSDELTFALQNAVVHISEPSVCEFLIVPVLRELWRPHIDALLMWSHAPLGVAEPLVGIPDYYFSRRSPLGLVREQPYLLVVQAKRDDFEEGWGNCLAAMLAAQQMNDRSSGPVFGCVTNGDLWQFGRLIDKHFTREIRGFALSDLSSLFAAWNYIFGQAKAQALLSAA